jgi:hypothetical protein
MIVTLQLSNEQERLLGPIVAEATALRNHVLFINTCGPNNGSWPLQAAVIPARVGSKILGILKKETAFATTGDVSHEPPAGAD